MVCELVRRQVRPASRHSVQIIFPFSGCSPVQKLPPPRSRYPYQGLSGGISEAVGRLDRPRSSLESPLERDAAGLTVCLVQEVWGWRRVCRSAHCQVWQGVKTPPGSAPPLGCREAEIMEAWARWTSEGWQIAKGEMSGMGLASGVGGLDSENGMRRVRSAMYVGGGKCWWLYGN